MHYMPVGQKKEKKDSAQSFSWLLTGMSARVAHYDHIQALLQEVCLPFAALLPGCPTSSEDPDDIGVQPGKPPLMFEPAWSRQIHSPGPQRPAVAFHHKRQIQAWKHLADSSDPSATCKPACELNVIQDNAHFQGRLICVLCRGRRLSFS